MDIIDFDAEYNLNNSKYNAPESEIYFMNVPFDSDKKDIVSFSSENEQISKFKALSSKHVTSTNIIKKDSPIKIEGRLGEFEEYNYVMYRNSSVSKKWWFAFIISISYGADDVTIINIKTDVWQSYQFDAKYYQSHIERAHVPINSSGVEASGLPIDSYFNYHQSEPVGVKPEYETLGSVFNDISWKPCYIIESTSLPDASVSAGVINKVNYLYGGYGKGEYNTPLFGILTHQNGSDYYDIYTNLLNAMKPQGILDTTGDHTADVQCIRVVPKFLYDIAYEHGNQALVDGYRVVSENTGVADAKIDTYKLDNTTLGNGYVPHNKKLLGSLCRIIRIYNKNGFSILIEPEHIRTLSDVSKGSDTISLNIWGSVVGMTGVILSIPNYFNGKQNTFNIPYNLTFQAGYNSNTGIQKTIGVLNSALQIGSGVANIAAGSEVSPKLAVAGATQVGSGLLSLSDALADKTGVQSTVADLSHYGESTMSIKISEINPGLDDTKAIDNFLDMYGYSINQHLNIKSVMNTRPYWNYIKTNNANIKIKGTSNDADEFRSIFDNGVTIWHGLDSFGKYSNKNW